MTKAELIQHLSALPDDCIIMSNSGWEYGESDIGGIWYNRNTNECHLTQGGAFQNAHGYERIGYPGDEKNFEKIFCTED